MTMAARSTSSPACTSAPPAATMPDCVPACFSLAVISVVASSTSLRTSVLVSRESSANSSPRDRSSGRSGISEGLPIGSSGVARPLLHLVTDAVAYRIGGRPPPGAVPRLVVHASTHAVTVLARALQEARRQQADGKAATNKKRRLLTGK